MKTHTVWFRIPRETTVLAATLRRVANRPLLSRRAGYLADEIQHELERRAAHALATV